MHFEGINARLLQLWKILQKMRSGYSHIPESSSNISIHLEVLSLDGMLDRVFEPFISSQNSLADLSIYLFLHFRTVHYRVLGGYHDD